MCIRLHVKCRLLLGLISMKLEFSRQIFLEIHGYEILLKSVQWEPSCTTRTDGQTDRHDEANSHFRQFCERA